MQDHERARSRGGLLLALLSVIVLGLASRKLPVFSALFGNSPGDALWAVMVFVGLALVFPRTRTVPLAIAALSIAFAVEFLQLYQAPWIQQIRATTLGHLALGSTFYWPDLLAYTVGVGIVAAIDGMLRKRRT